METTRIILLILVWATMACSSELDSNLNPQLTGNELIIRSGISYNDCMGYCTAELTITQTVSRLKRISNNGQKIQNCTWPTKTEVWNQLVSRLDTHQLAILPSQIDCSDCPSQGTEWLDVQHSGKVYQKSFHLHSIIPEISPLLEQLHQQYTEARESTYP